ncbi:MAG TPA: RecX family transcriptional regulator [Anaerolineaceae bacterium]|nr:RecX family transcriptional regulator [Anaerolineaceae bacterium]
MEKTITAIEAQKHNRSRVNIILDGVYAFSLDQLTAAWLKSGLKLNEQQIAQLLAKDEQQSAYSRALHFLSYRSRSYKEVRTYLEHKGYATEVVEAVLAQLEQDGLIDDARFSREWVENRTTFRPRSQSMLGWELKRKGISPEAIETALTDADLDDADLALQAARRALGRYAELPWEDFARKLGAYLQRRGFSAQVTWATVCQLWNDMQDSSSMQDR